MKRIITILLATAPLLSGAAIAQETAASLIRAWHQQNKLCRGGTGTRAEAACEAREVYDKKLSDLGWCYGKEGQPQYQMEWHRCTRDSIRAD